MILSDPSPASPEPRLSRRLAARRGRRRKRGQLIIPLDAEGRGVLLTSLAHRGYPTYELFLFAALCGAILGLGYVLDSQALLIFGILLAPLMLPWAGLLLAAITGSARFFFETLMALILSAGLVFGFGLLAGFMARGFLPRTLSEAYLHSRLWWPDLLILALGAVILIVSFVRSDAKPFMPSIVLAYELFLPLGAGGFGLGSGIEQLWPHGLLVFLVHFAWACVFGLLTLAVLKILPGSAGALVFSTAVTLLLLAILAVLMSAGNWTSSFAMRAASSIASLVAPARVPEPTLIPSAIALSPVSPIATPTTVSNQSSTPTVDATLPVELPVVTYTATAPVYAQVVAPRGGAVLRETPGGKGLLDLDSFTFVELLPDTQIVSGVTWAHVAVTQNGNRFEGWMVQLYLETATPGAGSGLLAAPTETPAQ